MTKTPDVICIGALERFCEIGVFPDWWKLADPGSQAAYCRGVPRSLALQSGPG